MSDLAQMIARLRDLLAEATPGPWEAVPAPSMKYVSTVQFRYRSGVAGTVTQVRRTEAHVGSSDLDQQNATAELVAECRNALPTLLEAVEAVPRLLEVQEIAGKQGGRLIRHGIVHDLLRNFVLGGTYHAEANQIVTHWLAADNSDVGVPWPESPWIRDWLAERGYSDCDDFIGIRATAVMVAPPGATRQ